MLLYSIRRAKKMSALPLELLLHQAIQKLNNVYSKKINKIYARWKLTNEKQKEGESMDAFANRLMILAKDCTGISISRNPSRSRICPQIQAGKMSPNSSMHSYFFSVYWPQKILLSLYFVFLVFLRYNFSKKCQNFRYL